jgi:predicted Zn-dependent protease
MNEPIEPADIFLWANKTDAIKNELDVELFLFNKNYTPYSTRFAGTLNAQIKPLFLFDYINFVNLGAGTGLSVRDYELSEAEDNVLLRTELDKVGRAETLIHLIEHERHDIAEFSESEHEFKRIKGVVARFTHKDTPEKVFYTVKLIQQNNVLKGATAWEFKDGQFGAFQAEVGLKLPEDNQVLIIDKDIFIYNQSKFERIFNYEFKKQALADKQVAEIEKQYKLSFPDGLDLQSLVKERKKTINKLQKLEVGAVSQEQAIAYADTMQLDLMADDDGSIIILDGRDLDMFVNLINEDYITSELTGKRYEIKSKRLLDEPEGEAPRGQA